MHPFRFGVVATPLDAASWQATARRVADCGFSTLLMPDGLQLLSPFSALAVAAVTAPELRVGTFVLAGPLRPARAAAWEAHSMSVLTDGRFDFGIGTGLPRVRQWAQQLGLPYGSASERLSDVATAVEHLRELDGELHTPVLMAARGPNARALAARIADTVQLAAGPLATHDEVMALAADVRRHAADREVTLALNLFAVGDGELPPWTQQVTGSDAATLRAHGSLALLPGATPRAMADELQRRRDSLGVSYITVNAAFLEPMAGVVDLLAGR
jgi:alkanesulfonate monooxygenase SsuD/methylene tetrahydromethanopterin reductase-like flavin-dependent oxidoreductase (luciferase family)